ncbi:MAG: N-acetylmuramoyl-L-alanine amidase [Caldilineaceae bacterium]|nr:N-acetylmuramoyl-L-alanine amidase [Caldilineaceae bacterium]
MRHQLLRRVQRLFGLVSFTLLLGIGVATLELAGYSWGTLFQLIPAGTLGALFNRDIAIISGHAGNDSGAICVGADGTPTVTEQAINAEVAERLSRRLRRGGATVTILEEFDPRLDLLQRDLLISLHADSCIESSGYKIAYNTRAEVLPKTSKLDGCFAQQYASITNLPLQVNTITHDMTDYHAFRKIAPTTPAVILEMGFLGGDQGLLQEQPETVARGIAESIRCFFQSANPPKSGDQNE